MDTTAYGRDRLATKATVVVALVAMSETLIDGSGLGAVTGGFALAWLAMLVATRRAMVKVVAARLAAIAAAVFALVLVDDPSLLAWAMFSIALSMAALLPRRGFDDALVWAVRLARHAFAGVITPVRDLARVAAIRDAKRAGAGAGGVQAVIRVLVLPLGGGAIFLALFASANPLIDQAFAQIVLPDAWTVVWRILLAAIVIAGAWTSLRPSAAATRIARAADRPPLAALDPGVATVILSLVTFNAIFLIENILDLVFLWSGAGLPAGVTMADYAHRGAYSLIVTALLAALFVLIALRPDSTGARSPAVRRLVALWIGQTLLLVASSALRTLDYVDAYGMTILRLSALAWMGLVATGLALIGWRLFAGRSAAWLINANALAATIVLALASVIDLGATAAGWNARIALTHGKSGPPLDLCYMARLGPSALVSLATLERHARAPGLRDRLAWLRWQAQIDMIHAQANWRSWTVRDARRLGAVAAIVGVAKPVLRAAPDGRGCDGSITPAPIVPAPVAPAPVAPPPAPAPLTRGTQR